MADFFTAYEGASAGDKLSREEWSGEKWVEAPADLTSRKHIDSLVLQNAVGTLEWERRMEDMAMDDWTVLP